MLQKMNSPKIKKSFILILLTAWLLPVNILLAADYGLTEANIAAGLKTDTIPTYLGRFAGAALALSGSIFLFLVVYGGIIMMTAAGNPETIGKGKKIIIWSIIGALILGAAYAITNLVFQVFT
ncbi:MAG: hypothetical protein NTX00_00795 [Candidatus Parcubacteria bacterium]|nr:hypothetical protein [Candidatus Parcubacteria bacterium]